jgi:hypothetical protein
VAELPDARGPARGLIRGTPGVLELRDRPGVALGRLVDEVEAALGRRFGHAPFVTPLLARVVHGVKGSPG